MDSVSFVLPSIGASDMPRDDQGSLVINQATAVVVASWLEHATRMVELDHNVSWWGIRADELPPLIDSVQDALKSF
jgi:hypothetical protein